jgi:hypothetical protein
MRLPPSYRYDAETHEMFPGRAYSVYDDAGVRQDVGETLFVERALLWVETETYNTLFPPLEGLKYVPIDASTPEGAKGTAYKQYTRVGIAKLVTERGGDLPTSKLFVREFQHQFYRLGMSYEYTLDDLLAAQFSAQNGGPALNIDMEQAMGAREGINKGLDAVSGIGSATSSTIPGLSIGIGPDVGLLGILNQPSASLYTPATGAQGSTQWLFKTPDEKVADLTGQYAAMVAGTFKIFTPDTFLLPITQYEQANGQRMGDGSDETVFSFYKKIKPGITIDSWQYCAGAGSGGTDRCLAYINNKRYVKHMISQMFRQMPPQYENLEFSVDCVAKTAGVFSPYPLSLSYMDNI